MYRLPSVAERSGCPAALTLIELVVVLVILAALTGIAVQSIEPVADQARFEATQRTLQEINNALLIESRGTDGQINYQGFIADLGRLPIALGSDPSTQPIELWANARGAVEFDVTNVDDPHTMTDESGRSVSENPIRVAAGWRGPYLQLAPAVSDLRDGYGREFTLLQPSTDVVVANADIAGFIARGADGLLDVGGESGYDLDMTLPSGLPNGLLNASQYEGDLTVRVTESDGTTPSLEPNESIHVRVFGPDVLSNSGGGVVVGGNAELTAGSVGGEFSHTFTDIVIGLKTLRAVKVTETSPDEEIVAESIARQIVVLPGQNPELTLLLYDTP